MLQLKRARLLAAAASSTVVLTLFANPTAAFARPGNAAASPTAVFARPIGATAEPTGVAQREIVNTSGATVAATPTVSLATAYLAGAVGSVGESGVSVTVAQAGGDATGLILAATASSKTSVAATGDVSFSGTGGTRQVNVAPRGVGYTDLTLKVTAPNGKSATTTLHLAASAAVQDAAATRYLTGAGDASAAIDAGDNYVIVGDDENNQLRLYRRDTAGAPVRSWDFSKQAGVSTELDLEAATRVGNTIYWTGSLGNSKSGELRPDRAVLFTTKITGTGANTQLSFGGAYHGLRADLIAWDQANNNRFGFAAGAAAGSIPKQIDGFNLEGLEFAPGSSTTAYLGFRAPLVPPASGGKALLITVTNMDKVIGGAPATFGAPITLDLGGLSVRDIRKNAADQYLIIAGSWAADDNSAPYALYSWDGVGTHAPVLLRSLPTADPGAWEAIVTVPDLHATGARVQLLTDAGAAVLYGDGVQVKDLTHPEWQKSRAVWFTLG